MIGVLSTAITVIMASVLGTFVLGFADLDERRPMVGFDFRYSSTGGRTVTHTYGDRVDAAALRTRGSGPDGTVSFGDWPTTGTVAPGDSGTLPDADGDETVMIVWRNAGRSFVLAK